MSSEGDFIFWITDHDLFETEGFLPTHPTLLSTSQPSDTSGKKEIFHLTLFINLKHESSPPQLKLSKYPGSVSLCQELVWSTQVQRSRIAVSPSRCPHQPISDHPINQFWWATSFVQSIQDALKPANSNMSPDVPLQKASYSQSVNVYENSEPHVIIVHKWMWMFQSRFWINICKKEIFYLNLSQSAANRTSDFLNST